MNVLTLNGLVVRSTDFGDYDKMLTLLTKEKGIISVTVKGGKSIRSRFSSVSELFCYAIYNLKKSGNYYYIYDGSVIEGFYPLRNDIAKLALATYICDVATSLSPEGVCDPDILQLALNTLHALTYRDISKTMIKASFEFKVAVLAGYMPDLECCSVCSKQNDNIMFLDTKNGRLLCSSCLSLDGSVNGVDVNSVLLRLPNGALQALRYLCSCSINRFLSFRLSDSDAHDFTITCEKYLINQLEREFHSLSFYKSISNHRI